MLDAPAEFPPFTWPMALALYSLGWLALFAAPLRHRFCWIFGRSCAVILALLYCGILVVGHPGLAVADFLLLTGGKAGQGLLALLALVLFVGSWQVEDSPRHRISHPVLLPVLLLTATTGPLGFVVHIGLRDIFKLQNERRMKDS